jgi:hypothetical protein
MKKTLKNIWNLYYDGFKNMTWGRPLWLLIFLKVIILFLVLRMFFFKPVLSGKDEAEKAVNFIAWIEDMNRKMGIPEKLDMIKDEDVEQIITWAMKEANPLYPTPVLWGREDFRKFINSVRV